MKHILLCAALLVLTSCAFAQSYNEPPDVATTRPASDFPVHVHIFGVHWNRINGFYEGYGRGDLLGTSPQGVDYTFSCAQPFLHNERKTEFYQGRWKKENQRLEILMQKVGSDKEQKCELKTSVKPEPYGKYAGAAGAGGVAPAPGSTMDAKPATPPPAQ